MEFKNLYCTRCGSEFEMKVKRTTAYSGTLHLPNLFCPFCGARRLAKKGAIQF